MFVPNKLTVVMQEWGCNGRRVNGLRLASMMVGPGELLPIVQLGSMEVGQTVTVGSNVWVRLPNPNAPIIAIEE